MDPTNTIPNKTALVADLTRARKAIERDISGLSRRLNYLDRLRNSVRKKPKMWLSGAALAGMILAKIPARRKKVFVTQDSDEANPLAGSKPSTKKAGALAMAFAIFKFLLPITKPIISGIATKQLAGLADWLESRDATEASAKKNPKSKSVLTPKM